MSEHKFKAGDKVAWKDANEYIRVGIMKERFPTGTCLIKTREIPFYVPEDYLFPAGNLVDTEEATEEFSKKLDEGFFGNNEELSGEEIVKMIKAVSDVKLEPIGLTKEMLGIEETGAVVKGRAKGFHIEDEWQKKYQEGYDAGYNACELAYQTKLQDQEEHMHTARFNVLRNCLEDIMRTLDADKAELAEVLEELQQAEVKPL